jgi:hypothetical protein
MSARARASAPSTRPTLQFPINSGSSGDLIKLPTVPKGSEKAYKTAQASRRDQTSKTAASQTLILLNRVVSRRSSTAAAAALVSTITSIVIATTWQSSEKLARGERSKNLQIFTKRRSKKLE